MNPNIENNTVRTEWQDERERLEQAGKRPLSEKSPLFGGYAVAIGISSILLATSCLLSYAKPPSTGSPTDRTKGFREAIKEIVLDKDPASRSSKLAKFLNKLDDEADRRYKATGTLGPSPSEVLMFDENGLEVDWPHKGFDPKVVKAIVIMPTPAFAGDYCSFLVRDPDASFLRAATAE